MEETKNAGIFEDEAVFVNKEEDETDHFEMIAGSDEVVKVANFENEARGLLDSVKFQAMDQNDDAEHARLPVKPHSCPSLSSLVLPNAMA